MLNDIIAGAIKNAHHGEGKHGEDIVVGDGMEAGLETQALVADSAHDPLGETLAMPLDDGGIEEIQLRLRSHILRLPKEIEQASGIVIRGRRIKSLIFSTDLAIIQNCDADAVFAVYPFTAHRSISASIIHAASIPVFCGVGGGTTQGVRAVYLANDAESQGAMGLVLNAPFPNRDLRTIARLVDVPIVVTVTREDTNVALRVRNGASIINVAAGAKTPELVAKIRSEFPKLPIMASGGKTAESVTATIEAGANAIVYTPPSSGELFRTLMDSYRE